MDKTFSEYCTQTSCSMCDYPSQCMKSKKTCEELWQANHDKQIRNEVIEEMVKEVDDVDMDSNYIYLKFDKEKYDIPNQITRKSELKDWVLEQMKGETE